MSPTLILPRLALATLVLFAAYSAAAAQDGVEAFYKGKTVNIVVGSSPGGGYDLYGRLIARHLGRHIPGNPSVVVSNMPGAASNVAAAYIYNVAPKDGTFIGAIFMGAVVEPLFGEKARTTHDTSKFNYIGNANKDVYICLVRTDAPVKTFGEAFDRELVLGSTAHGASTRDYPEVLKNLLGVKFKIVAGYTGTHEVNLAIEKGEVQGGCGETWSSVAATYPYWFRDNTVKVLVQEDMDGYPDLNRRRVPLTPDFAKTDEQRQILDLFYSQTTFGRPYVVAPEVPKDRVEALRKAFMDTMQDADLKADAQRMNVDVMPIAGQDLQSKIARMFATPQALIEKTREVVADK